MNVLLFQPTDVLFFRDGRPFETSGGHGARWPQPSVVFDAIHAALWRAFPTVQSWEHRHDYGRSSNRPRAGDTQRFGSLVTAGPFPVRLWDGAEQWLFPAPADVLAHGNKLYALQVRTNTGLPEGVKSNLPKPLRYPVVSPVPPLKHAETPAWWSAKAWSSYLEGRLSGGGTLKECETATPDDLYASESMTGIGISAVTGAQDREHIYAAEYLRLRPGVSMGALASMPMKQNGNPQDRRECLGHLFEKTKELILGGQQRVVCVSSKESRELPLPRMQTNEFNQHGGKFLVKWVLLSPSIWPRLKTPEGEHRGGWLPNWVDEKSGAVLLKYRTGKRRREWDPQKRRFVRRAENESDINAYLVAAVVPKAIAISGWTERIHLVPHESDWTKDGKAAHGARPLSLAVPAGAVYYFEADSADDAKKLAAVLNWHGTGNGDQVVNRRSTLLGEKGFGLGVCGTWRPVTSEDVSAC
ncbi:MAG: type III-B CRISPR module-associated protein Cmr3 [Kiritimatiellae bacterium]|nr:type III-B CRISPR module-associated protein Cmr3 [Kiritimatiellia bacterium]